MKNGSAQDDKVVQRPHCNTANHPLEKFGINTTRVGIEANGTAQHSNQNSSNKAEG
jgi:hypothetical protein